VRKIGLAIVALGLMSGSAMAQSLSGLKVGDNIAGAARTMGMAPAMMNQSGPFVMEKWALPDGNELSATAIRATGRIVYIESDWGGKRPGSVSDYSGVVYGKTNFDTIRTVLGSSGLTFNKHFAIKMPDASVAFFNCYQVKSDPSVIATFVTTLKPNEVRSVEAGKTPITMVATMSTVASVILADATYLKQIWGDDIEPTPNYSPIEWR
jgi:hypothetical protein